MVLPLKVLVVGSGAREHALAWKISQSKQLSELYIAPGNAGTATIATNLNINSTDIEQLCNIAQKLKIDTTIIGPEVPLASGIVDYFQNKNLNIFGPTKLAAQIESSKVFSKNLMLKYGIPCAEGQTFSDFTKATNYVKSIPTPVVIKADGLASGKGVFIAKTKSDAIGALKDIMVTKLFGSAGNKVIIENFLTGMEVSLLAFTDGKTVIPMVPACDYKRAFDNDVGPNTGGMGSYSPPGFFNESLIRTTIETIVKPTIVAMSQEGTPYKGVLYTGLIVTDHKPRVLEYNARFGDPETQVILPRLRTDLLDIITAIIHDELHKIKIEWENNACVSVVMASGGYPGIYKTGFDINGLNQLDNDITVFHAGTRKNNKSSAIVTDGGRVLSITATGSNLREARNKVYKNISNINFLGCNYRHDIAAREVN